MPQMAPFYWVISLVLVWFVLVTVVSLMWWICFENNYFFNYKSWGI
uniref:ATP synthase subunit 8 n=1 Tax=Semelidae sp. STW-2017 TaxID=1969324 RepID=A0A1U9XPA9_9BIVA|nr:ATP synthase subunit 8 [Semelidae sp. STW-2017]